MSTVAARWRGSTRQQLTLVAALLPAFMLVGVSVSMLVSRFGATKVVWVLAIFLGGLWTVADLRRAAAVLTLALAFPFRTKFVFGLEVHTTHLLLAGIAGLGLVQAALRRRQIPRGVLGPLALFVVGAVIASLAGPFPGPSLLRTAWGVALPVAAALVLATTLRSGRDVRGVIVALAVGVAGESLIALAQAVGKAPAIFPMWEAHRAVGLFLHPNILGSFLAASMLILAGVAATSWRASPVTAVALVIVVMLGLGGLVATESRGAVIGLTAGTATLVVVMVTTRRTAAALTMLAIFALAVAVTLPRLPEAERVQFAKRFEQLSRPGSEAGRDRIYKEARNVMAEYPLTGVGPLTFGQIGSRRSEVAGIECCLTHSHNVALEATLSVGPLGLAGFLALLASSVAALLRVAHRRKDPVASGWAVGALGALTALLVAGIFDFVFWQPEMLVVLLLVLVSGPALAQGRRSG